LSPLLRNGSTACCSPPLPLPLSVKGPFLIVFSFSTRTEFFLADSSSGPFFLVHFSPFFGAALVCFLLRDAFPSTQLFGLGFFQLCKKSLGLSPGLRSLMGFTVRLFDPAPVPFFAVPSKPHKMSLAPLVLFSSSCPFSLFLRTLGFLPETNTSPFFRFDAYCTPCGSRYLSCPFSCLYANCTRS